MKLRFLITLPLIAMLGACSTTYNPETDFSQQYDFEQADTYAVVGDQNLKNPLISDIERERINTAIGNSLEMQGIEQAEIKEADVVVTYFVVTKDKTQVYGSTSGYYGRYGYGGAAVNDIHVRNYVEGTLVVDVVDTESNKSIWRSTLSKPMKKYDNAQEREQAIQQAIGAMFQEFPNNAQPTTVNT